MMTMLRLSICLLPLTLQAQNGAERAWEVLSAGLADKSYERRAHAVHALGLAPDTPRTRGAAEKALKDDRDEVRASAASALGHMGAKESSATLQAAIQDKSPDVVFAAANALLRLNDPAAYQVFYAVLLGEKKTGESLTDSQLKMLKDPKALTKLGFETGIGFIPFGGVSYKVFKMVTKDDVSPVRAAAAAKLAHDPDPKSAAALRQSASDPKWLVRAAVASAIAERGDPSLLDALTPLLDDTNEIVRYTAAAATLRLSAKR